MAYNAVLDQKVIEDAPAEPVTLEEAKAYIKVDYTEEDAFINSLIRAARKVLEEKYDIGIVEKTLKVIINNSCGGRDLPGSPVGEIVSVATKGGPITDYDISGDFHRYVEWPVCDYVTVTYKSGYPLDQVPAEYKTAIMAQVLWMFERRGDQDINSQVSPEADGILKFYKRNSFGLFL